MESTYAIISSTNRKGAMSYRLALIYQDLMSHAGIEAQLIDLEQLPPDFVFTALYDNSKKNQIFNEFQRVITASTKFVFIVPEYNGSFPGVLKAFIDGLEYPSSFRNKKAALVGISSGNQGSALALSHLADIFNYLGMHVFAQKPRLMRIENNLLPTGALTEQYLGYLKRQVEGFLEF
ncbi:MAG: NAD(P)H-dependent oxidoreductase [Bacteroidetes bacterium]|jgi:NAD(P)H-dependent FMN reductase|nr:NAD(P)H-dependent oxidoreductase [Bacteroidota bacterium]